MCSMLWKVEKHCFMYYRTGSYYCHNSTYSSQEIYFFTKGGICHMLNFNFSPSISRFLWLTLFLRSVCGQKTTLTCFSWFEAKKVLPKMLILNVYCFAKLIHKWRCAVYVSCFWTRLTCLLCTTTVIWLKARANFYYCPATSKMNFASKVSRKWSSYLASLNPWHTLQFCFCCDILEVLKIWIIKLFFLCCMEMMVRGEGELSLQEIN
jgi:hypothetical protein